MIVEHIRLTDIEIRPYQQYRGFCPNCGRPVIKDQYGVDEVCRECGTDLEWIETSDTRTWKDEAEEDYQAYLEQERRRRY